MDELVEMVRGQLDPAREGTWQVEISGGVNADQWARLRAAGRLPEHLAAARRAGQARLTDLVDWSDWVLSAR